MSLGKKQSVTLKGNVVEVHRVEKRSKRVRGIVSCYFPAQRHRRRTFLDVMALPTPCHEPVSGRKK
jgi:hypothetical protein